MASTTFNNRKREIADEEKDAPREYKRVKQEQESETNKLEKERNIAELIMADVESDAELAAAVLLELYNLTTNDSSIKEDVTQNSQMIVGRGGQAVILRAMKKHADSVLVQQHGFAALGNITCDIPDANEGIASLGSIEMAVSALKEDFRDELDLQRSACLLLGNLCDSQQLASRVVLEHPEAISNIVAAMNAFPMEAKVQSHGCMALKNIAALKTTTACQSIIQSDGLVALAKARTNHSDDNDIVSYFGDTMSHLLGFQ